MNHPKQDLTHSPVVDWVEEKYLKLYNRKPRDTWRGIRRLHQQGLLIKIKKGVYRYDPDLIQIKDLYEFPPEIKEEVFKRDGYKCVICGRGKKDGWEIHVDHIKPIDKGGTNTVENGQTLCSEHNLLKKNYSQTEFGKRLFIRLYHQAIEKGDEKIKNFCECVLDCYDNYGINHHIERPNFKRKIKRKE